MIIDLNVAKRQTWYEKERYSDTYEEDRRRNLAEKVRKCINLTNFLIPS